MTRWCHAFAAACCVLQPAVLWSQQPTVFRIPVTGAVELGLAPYISRTLREAEEAGAKAAILDVNTLGGRVDAALDIVDAISRAQVPVYALVNPRAISAGALISVATDSVFMVLDALIGASTVVGGQGEKMSEKAQSMMRAQYRALAERRGIDPRIGEAMVDETIAIEGVIEEGRLLTLTADEATRVGYGIKVEGFDDLLDRLGLTGADVVTPGINWAEQLVRFLSHPIVSPLLLSIGVLGLIIEIKTPSFGIAGAVGLLSLGAFFGSHLIIGLAGLEEIILLAVGLVALAIEVFVVPGFGIAGMISILCIGSAIFLALIGSLPTWGDIARASGILFAAAIIVVAAIYVLVRQLPSGRGTRGIFLKAATAKDEGYIAGATRDDLIGLEGVALTDLRPAGTVQVGEERLDVVSDIGYVAKGARVRIIRSESYRHVVEPIDEGSGA
ncbi:MAG: nodulation protein NfeD [Gemmatimonadales bacterium]|nr:nodulation protein NfeD [Gemmatimonadales bacterium]NIN12448.1 nodulation protein NfeD [Gemmatimonadales bacterium]NIN50824.1 nodulation protein NfeD [Gemmatimonadales bacterium]NIP08288.1 nodulation protein NfeD [Gemmatimonadales bacterium]NIR00812.1 nodulation protein NfeD [Gemmatimonadales bacterium]